MKKQGNETTRYMELNNWRRVSDGGTAGIYSNGKLFVMCNGIEWFVSSTPDASWRYARGFSKMISAFKFADRLCAK